MNILEIFKNNKNKLFFCFFSLSVFVLEQKVQIFKEKQENKKIRK
jgi:hypothetical protein